jgi:hypothetical protein
MIFLNFTETFCKQIGVFDSNKIEKRQFFRKKMAKIAENCDHNIGPWYTKCIPTTYTSFYYFQETSRCVANISRHLFLLTGSRTLGGIPMYLVNGCQYQSSHTGIFIFWLAESFFAAGVL